MNVYLDYAATTPLDREVYDAMYPLYFDTFGNPDSLHSFGRRADYAVACARDEIAALLGVKNSEVYFTSGGTEADHFAVRSISAALKKRVAISAIEHHAVLGAGEHVRDTGVDTIPVKPSGTVGVDGLNSVLTPDTGLVCVMAVNNETGVVQPVRELAEAAHGRGAYFFCDCVQAACTQDLKELVSACDAISLSAHKFYGPKGVGVAVVKEGVPTLPYTRGGEQERGLRGGTLNTAGIVGLALALKNAQKNREQFCAHTVALRDAFERAVLTAFSGRVTVDGGEAERAPNVSHLTFTGEAEALLQRLDLEGVAVSGGAACSAHTSLPSHVMLAMGRGEREAKSGVRFSFGKHTTKEEVDYAVNALVKLIK